MLGQVFSVCPLREFQTASRRSEKRVNFDDRQHRGSKYNPFRGKLEIVLSALHDLVRAANRATHKPRAIVKRVIVYLSLLRVEYDFVVIA